MEELGNGCRNRSCVGENTICISGRSRRAFADELYPDAFRAVNARVEGHSSGNGEIFLFSFDGIPWVLVFGVAEEVWTVLQVP